MNITPGQWALIICVVVLFCLHAGVFITLRKLSQKVKELEGNDNR